MGNAFSILVEGVNLVLDRYWFWTGNLWYLWYGLWWSGALDFERMPGSYEAADFKFVWRFGVMNQDSYSILL